MGHHLVFVHAGAKPMVCSAPIAHTVIPDLARDIDQVVQPLVAAMNDGLVWLSKQDCFGHLPASVRAVALSGFGSVLTAGESDRVPR